MRMQYYQKYLILLLAAGFFFLCGDRGRAEPVYHADAHTTVDFIPEVSSIAPGQSFRVALKMTLDEEWHVYWKNAGDSGLPPRVKWDLPEGFSVGQTIWPIPKLIYIDPLMSYGYEGEVQFLFPVNVPNDLQDGAVYEIKAKVEWLACKIECVPGTLEFTLPLSTSLTSVFNPQFSIAESAYPSEQAAWDVSVYEEPQSFLIEIITQGSDGYASGKIQFYPESNELINHAAVQSFTQLSGRHHTLRVEKSDLFKPNHIDFVDGLLVIYDSADVKKFSSAFYFRSELKPISQRPAHNYFIGGSHSRVKRDMGLGLAAIFAFIGGLILNLMPCVLPVLSLKILGLIEQAGENRKKSFRHGMAFTLGILAAFWFLASLMLILKFSGKQIGWGFQFQSPAFLIVLSALFVWLALNLFGVFEIGASLTQLNQYASKSLSLRNSFFNGILATAVATPCTAPFMGSALGFALVKPPVYSLAVFSALGLGLAFPYLVLSRFPQALRFVPKPGPWMVTLKKCFGIVFLATASWLVWVLSIQRGSQAARFVILGLMVISVGGWVTGTKAGPTRERAARARARVAAFGIVLLGFGIAFIGAYRSDGISRKSAQKTGVLHWLNYSPELIRELRTEGRPIFLDFTAAWCLTCQVNDRVAFHNEEVIAKFKQLDVAAIKADWTNYDEEITQALESFNKSSIPLYVVYPADSAKEPFFLPEILTPGIVLDALEKMR